MEKRSSALPMPEGWFNRKLYAQEDEQVGLDLMKEMAEAIGRVTRQLQNSNLISEGAANQLKRAEQDFREWK